MDDLIAGEDIIGIKASGERIAIKLRIGRPYKNGINPETWACPVTMEPLHPRVGNIVGNSSFQAVCLASRLALYLLAGFKEDGSRLTFNDGTDFPLEAYGVVPSLGERGNRP